MFTITPNIIAFIILEHLVSTLYQSKSALYKFCVKKLNGFYHALGLVSNPEVRKG